MKRFLISIIDYHWSCGTGCCSDSGYKCEVEDREPPTIGYGRVYENDGWENNPNSDILLKRAKEAITQWLGREVTENDYEIEYETQYSDEESEENT